MYACHLTSLFDMKVLSIGPDKDLLKEGSVSHKRHAAYAAYFDEFHAVVFARKEYGCEKVSIAPNAWSYPTGSPGTLQLFIDAYRIARRLLSTPGEWVISVQDPFESALVGYVLSRVTRTPLLIQEHGDFFSSPYWRRESWANRIRYVFGRWLIHQATRIRVVDRRIKHTLTQLGVPKERISVAPVYVDSEVYHRAQPDPTVRALCPPNGVLILTMARLVPQKNLTLLIQAFGMVLAQGVSAHLVIVGRGPERVLLEALATQVAPHHITFLDWTDTPASVMRAADIYALSSNYEGWGRVCIEALAAEVPLIMTDVGCAHSVVKHKHNGLVVPVGDAAHLAAALHILATNATLRDALCSAGRATIDTLPTQEESIKAYVATIRACRPNPQSQHHPHDHVS